MFIGSKAIERIDWTTVYFATGDKKEYTDKALSYIVTEELQDPTAYRQLVLTNILPEIKLLLDWSDTVEIVSKIMLILEQHDVTNSEMQSIITHITSDLIEWHNNFLKEKVWKEMDDFKIVMEKYKEITQVLSESYEQGLFIALGKAFGTYEEWVSPSNYLDNIRVSDLARYIKL